MSPRRTALVFFRRLAKTIAIVLLCVVCLVASALLFAFVAPNTLRQPLNAQLEQMFEGQLIVDEIGAIRPGGVKDVDLSLKDPSGREIARAWDVSARFSWWELVQQLIGGGTTLHIKLDKLDVAALHLDLSTGAQDELLLGRALESTSPSKDNSSEVLFELARAHVKTAWIYTRNEPDPLDLGLKSTKSGVRWKETTLTLEQLSTQVSLRSPQTPFDQVRLEGQSRLEFVDEKEGDEGPLAGLRSQSEVSLTTEDAKLNITLTNDRDQFDVTAHATVPPRLASGAGLKLDSIAKIDIHAEGTLDDFATLITARHGQSELRANVHLVQSDGTHLSGQIIASDIRPDLFSVEGLSPISATVNFEAVRQGDSRFEIDRWSARGTGAVESLELQERSLPPLSFEAKFADRQLQLASHVEGSDTDRVSLRAWLDQKGAIQKIQVRGQLSAARLLGTLNTEATAQGTVRFESTLSPRDGSLDANVSGQLKRIRQSSELAAEKLDFEGSIHGQLDNPDIVLHMEGQDTTVGGRKFESFSADFNGRPTEGQINAEFTSGKTRTNVTARVALLNGDLNVDNVSLEATGQNNKMTVSLDELTVRNGHVNFSSVRISGLGTSDLSGSYGPQGLTLEGFVRDVPLDQLSDVLPITVPLSGVIDLDVDFRLADRNMTGRVRAVLSKLRATDDRLDSVLSPAEVHVDLAGDGAEMVAWVSAEWDSDHQARASNIHVQTTIWTPALAKWPDAQELFARVKEAEVHFDAELAPVSSLLPNMEVTEGRVDGYLQLSRSTLGAEPTVRADLRGSGLDAIVRRPPDSQAPSSTLITLDEIGLQLRLESDLSERRVSCSLRVSKADRELFTASLSTPRSLYELLALREADSWGAVPLNGTLIAPRLSLDSLPSEVRPSGLEGTVSAEARFKGTPLSPRASVHFELEDFGPVRYSDDARAPFSGTIEGHFERGALDWSAALRADKSELKSQGQLQVNWQPDQKKVVLQQLDAELSLKQFSLDSIPQLERMQVKGPVDAELIISNWGSEKERVRFDASLDEVRIQQVPLSGGTLNVELKDGIVEGRVHLEGPDYFLTAEGRSEVSRDGPFGVIWGPAQNATVQAQAFPLTILQPAVGQQMAGLEGRLSIDMKVRREPTGAVVSATADLKDGAVQIPSVGQRLRNIDAQLNWSEQGELQIEDATFSSTSGRGTFELEAQTDGLVPREGSMRISVDRDERLPVSLAGFGMGEAWGDVTTAFQLDFEERTVTTDTKVKEFQLWLPRLPTNQAQTLSPAEAVTVGTRVESEGFVEIPLQPVDDSPEDPNPWTIRARLDLGDNFWLAQGTLRRIQVSGAILLESGSELKTSGTLYLPRGQFELNGRMFEVHRGTITLQPEEPDNPIIVAEAHWESPDGTLVIAKFTGPAQSGEMSLSSDPPLRNDQIVSLLLFGDPSGLGHSSSGDNSTNQAAVVGGSVATQGINNALRRYEGIDLSTRVRGEDNNVRPELVLQLTNSLSAQLGYNLEEPSPGKSPDRTLLTFELRLMGGSSLSLTAGDRGTTLFDWVWRYRY